MKGFRSMKKRVDSLNLVRVGLIFTIFLCHSGDMLPDVIGYYAGTLTGYALQLFFMISGFCCLLSGYGKDLSTGPYMKKRWWKIFPMHFVGFLLMAFLIIYRAWAGGYDIDKSDFLAQAVVNLLFLQAWTPNEDFVYSFNGVSWFLSALFFCYLLTPVMIRILKRFENYAPWLLITVAFLQFGYALYFNHFIGTGSFYYTNVFPPYRFLEYLMGALLAVMYLKRRDGEGIPRSSMVQLVTVFLFFAVYVITKHEMGFTRFFIVLELYLMYALCVYEGKVSDWGASKLMASLADHIMPFYLVHSIVLKYMREFVLTGSSYTVEQPIIPWIASLAIAIAFSYAYMAIDKRARAAWQRRKQAKATA